MLLVLVVLVVAALVAVNFVAQAATEKAMSNRIKDSTGAQKVSVSISSFPYLYDVLAEGRISRIDMTASKIPVGALTLAKVSVDARQVRFDRHDLFSSHQVHLTSISSATVTVLVDTAGLKSLISNSILGSVVSFPGDDTVEFDLAGIRVTGTLEVVDGHELALVVDGRQLYTLDLTRVPLVPDCDLALQSVSDGYDLSCTVSPVPASVIAAISNSSSS